jgi:hypothetical protein
MLDGQGTQCRSLARLTDDKTPLSQAFFPSQRLDFVLQSMRCAALRGDRAKAECERSTAAEALDALEWAGVPTR